VFSSEARRKLKYYVYLYIDPRTNRPFYVGKGKGNRCFSHLRSCDKSEKAKILDELRKLELKPSIDILKYGLTEPEALLVEATAIDLLDLGTLANEVRGHGTKHGSRATVADVAAMLTDKRAKISDPVVLININRAYRPRMGLQALYDATRASWKVAPDRHKPAYALSVYRGVVREVFAIETWLRAGRTMRLEDVDGRPPEPHDRWEFVGRVAKDEIRKKYIHRSVADDTKRGAQNPVRYVHC
jgi:uncharacterized protein